MILTCLVFRWICTRCGISIRVIFSLISVGAVMLNVAFLATALATRTTALNDIALDLDTLTAALPDFALRSLDPRLENTWLNFFPQ